MVRVVEIEDEARHAEIMTSIACLRSADRAGAHPVTDAEHNYSGKVRDIYDAGDGLLLFVASGRLSPFDMVLGETVPNNGRALTSMSTFLFDAPSGVLPNHVVATDVHPAFSEQVAAHDDRRLRRIDRGQR